MDLTQERYDRIKAGKLTRYTREEILAAALAYETAYAEQRRITDEADALCKSFVAILELADGVQPGTYQNQIRWTQHLDELHSEVYHTYTISER